MLDQNDIQLASPPCTSEVRSSAHARSSRTHGWRTIDADGQFALPRTWMPGLPSKIKRPAASPHSFLKRAAVSGGTAAELLRGAWMFLPRTIASA